METYKYGIYIQRKRRLINLAENMEQRHNRLWEMTDSELNLYNRGSLYPHSVSIDMLNERHPELATDPAFQKLKFFYDSLKNRGLREGATLILRSNHNSYTLDGLNALATDMANRAMNEETYNDILNEKVNCIYEAKRVIEEVPLYSL